MAEIIRGLSNLTQQVQSGSGYETQFVTGNNPANKYQAWKENSGGIKYLQFPPDMPEFRIVLIGREFTLGSTGARIFGNTGEAKTGYILPLPQMRLNDRYQIGYDDNFSWINMLTRRVPGAGLLEETARASGFNLNKFKTVLMEAPMLKRHEFIWKLSPKNASESLTIRNIVNGLKQDMAPPTLGPILRFSYIFDVFFDPNWKQMYSFKLSVIESLDVDYAGGNPHPANYFNGDPESVVISMNLIEIEIWTREDYVANHSASNPVSATRNTNEVEPREIPNVNAADGGPTNPIAPNPRRFNRE